MGTKKSRVAELADFISVHTARLDAYLSESNLPEPSFDADGPGAMTLPPEMQEIRDQILDANLELQELLLGPKEVMADCPVRYVFVYGGHEAHVTLLSF
jgi:hypothetical protein